MLGREKYVIEDYHFDFWKKKINNNFAGKYLKKTIFLRETFLPVSIGYCINN